MFERGFKTWCEQSSLALRKELRLRGTDPIDPWKLAEHLSIQVKTTLEHKGLSTADRECLEGDSAWSALTLEVGGKKRIILKASNSPGRKSSDLTHEIAHQLLGHKAVGAGKLIVGHLMVHSFSQIEEDQANWLSGTLLLPRAALLHIKKQFSDDNEAAAATYKVSVAMLKYRLGVTGVNYQLRRGYGRP